MRCCPARSKTRGALAAVALLSLSSLSSQTPPQLVGVTSLGAVEKRSHVPCVVTGRCAPPGFPASASPVEGGTAYDPIHDAIWITNGAVLALVNDRCEYVCPPMPIPLPVAQPVGGLEFVESQNELWMIHTGGLLSVWRPTCPPALLRTCNVPMPGLVPAFTGLAVDEGAGLVFYSHVSVAGVGAAVEVARIAAPCAPFHRELVPPCTTVLNDLTGLAIDWCHTTLYGTDGRTTRAWTYVYNPAVPSIAFTFLGCCTPPVVTIDPMVGLALRSGGATSLGSVCSNGFCPNCPLVHELANGPNVGNMSFALTLSNAPANDLAWDLIGAAPCASPGVLYPPLCGPVLIQAPLGAIGPIFTGGGISICDGSARFGLPLPLLPVLCGIPVSSQVAVLCRNPLGIGTQLSPCLSFELQGN